jgi:hypothetical protein
MDDLNENFLDAAYLGNCAEVKRLLKAGADVHANADEA